MNSAIHVVTSAAHGEMSEIITAFAEDLRQSCRLPQVVLLDGQSALDSVPTLDGQSVVLLNADRADVMELLACLPLAAAVEKYALFAWWRKRGKSNGAFWLHGSAPVSRQLGPNIRVSGLYSTETHC